MSKYSYMTQDGFDKLKSELEVLKTQGRQDAAKAIAEAREKGDLSENAEYDAAKEAQGLLELKISEMEKTLSTARVIKQEDLDASSVVILSTIKIKQVKTKKEFEYTLVSQSEANLRAGKISVDSPIGKGLLGKKVGEIAEVQTPGGIMEFEILDIAINL
ncbi:MULTISPECIES: transcription elongation factor GreA [unclassified Aureispira]|uniref:transcription elongation factor GreA n=1 Tax=unclassified Aureispira TaxID=2649989 RepID=UPI000698D5AF|nr:MULTISPECIES: transcription elongation factor GreA [unclassified Aureispira]WMX14324.1 transcription elongation factor GreA [Aureispira sp. CCB-E]